MRSLIVDGASVEVAVAGQGVKVSVHLQSESEPRPVGDKVFFFLPQDEETARELADQRVMEATFLDFEVTPEDIQTYGLPPVETDEEIADSPNEDSSEEAQPSADDFEEEEDQRPVVVLKTDSGMFFS